MSAYPLPTYFISHGGGPWPWMKAQMGGMYDRLEASLADMPRQIGTRPAAVLVVSGHWEAAEFTVMATPNPPMIYDYSGFPEHTYRIHYRAPGAPALAERVKALIEAAGMPARLDTTRGFDHGTYAPLVAVYPRADVPVLQLSLKSGYDPAAHLALGRALRPLRDEGVLIVGSGLSYHNLRALGPQGAAPSKAFDDWLTHALVDLPPAERTARITAWSQAPAARIAHPQEDHLIPLMVALGAAEDEVAERVYHEDGFFGAISVSSYRFGAAAGSGSGPA